jgi:hypothetical protein
MVAQFCEADHRKWDTNLSDLVFAINSSRHDSTGFSPAFLNFGRELDPPNPLYREISPTESDTNRPPDDDATRVSSHVERIRKLKDFFDLFAQTSVKLFLTKAATIIFAAENGVAMWKIKYSKKIIRCLPRLKVLLLN